VVYSPLEVIVPKFAGLMVHVRICWRERKEAVKNLRPSLRFEQNPACENIAMLVSIELPERLVDALESRAREQHSSVQAVAIEAIENDLARVESEGACGRRVKLPLIRSANPGSLQSLTNAEIDGILGN
jgi:hypothetical protein